MTHEFTPEEIGRLDQAALFKMIDSYREQRKFRPTVVAIICDKSGRFLLVATQKSQSSYGFLQGGIEQGESPETALHREAQEEINIPPQTLTDLRLLGIAEIELNKRPDDMRGFTDGKAYFVYFCKYPGNVFKIRSYDRKEITGTAVCTQDNLLRQLGGNKAKIAFLTQLLYKFGIVPTPDS